VVDGPGAQPAQPRIEHTQRRGKRVVLHRSVDLGHAVSLSRIGGIVERGGGGGGRFYALFTFAG
ncbi:hypothetical protein ABTE55_18920, partial [Acinetobacter baumannii]